MTTLSRESASLVKIYVNGGTPIGEQYQWVRYYTTTESLTAPVEHADSPILQAPADLSGPDQK